MPYAQRDAQGRLIAVHDEARADAREFIPAASPEVTALLGSRPADAAFNDLDLEFVRVIEDVIDVLIDKNLITLTDLPPQAQAKLLARQRLRRTLGEPGLLSEDQGLL
ncbi:hypothetical protein ACTSKR_04855 [Chitinibacteraceae bacterium HSL-7]